MSAKRSNKGKRKAEDPHDDRSSPETSQTSARVPVKKPKRAETRPCPVCDEPIPLRLMEAHARLESERVSLILDTIGSTEVNPEVTMDTPGAGPSVTRRSAAKARQAITPGAGAPSSLQTTTKTIRAIERHRKARQQRLRELARDDDEVRALYDAGRGLGDGEGVCPVCLAVVRGDADVVEAHVDACLAHEDRLREERERREREEVDVDGWEDEGGDGFRIASAEGMRNMGIHVRMAGEMDVDGDVDVDGEDEALFGEAQFTEGDVVASGSGVHAHRSSDDLSDLTDDERDRDPGVDAHALRELVAEGKVVRNQAAPAAIEEAKATMNEVMGLADADRTELAILAARRKGNPTELVAALEGKIKLLESMKVSSSTSSLCRICLDPYTEPTVSTGCWHTCCRECWLRCLGSTKLCPMCKRITAAIDLRRVYL